MFSLTTMVRIRMSEEERSTYLPKTRSEIGEDYNCVVIYTFFSEGRVPDGKVGRRRLGFLRVPPCALLSPL